MPINKPIYCWDTSIFIAWLKNEQRPNGEMDGVFEAAEMIQSNKAILIASAILTTELVPCRLPPSSLEIIDRLFKRRNIQMKSIDIRVLKLSQNIRDWNPKITSEDAIHLSTAILYSAEQFHTFDDGKKGGISLLSLNGDVAGYPLVICKPPITQYRLPGI